MKKLLSLTLALALIATVFASCAKKPTETLNLFTWAGMFPQEVLDGFTAETGIAVNYVNFDTDETMLSKLETAKGGDYDVVIADDYILEAVFQKGLAQKLDKTKITNFANVNPLMLGQFYDPADEYTVPYGAGLQAIVYNPKTVGIEINGYADLWDQSLKDSIGIIGNYRVINGMALKIMGESYNTEDIDKIEKAGVMLFGLAPNIRLIKDDNLQDDLISGEISVAVMYASQVTLAMLANPELKVVFPAEGLGFGVMSSFIPSNAPNAEAAHKFINYLLVPENAKKCIEHIGYYCTTKAADELIDDKYKSFLTLPDNFADAEMIKLVSGEAEEAHAKAWTEFKDACD